MEQETIYTINSSDKLSILSAPTNNVRFLAKGECIITIDDTGFKYKDQLIEDGGEVYRLFKEFLIQAKNN